MKWKDDSTSWERLANLKESFPVEVANYAVSNGIDSDPAFAWWWVLFTILRRNRIIAAVNSRYHKWTHKFGIEVPKTWDGCLRLAEEAGNTLWQDAVCKEVTKVRVALQVSGGNETPPQKFQQIRCHLIFEIKWSIFNATRQDWLLAVIWLKHRHLSPTLLALCLVRSQCGSQLHWQLWTT